MKRGRVHVRGVFVSGADMTEWIDRPVGFAERSEPCLIPNAFQLSMYSVTRIVSPARRYVVFLDKHIYPVGARSQVRREFVARNDSSVGCVSHAPGLLVGQVVGNSLSVLVHLAGAPVLAVLAGIRSRSPPW